jgi:hyperosmotically inducible protein
MARLLPMAVATAFLMLSFPAPVALAQAAQANQTWNRNDAVRIVQEVQKRIGSLPDYAVFDWITFGIRGRTLVLKGYASRPIVKQDAGNAVKGIPGIASVDNEIQVLPLSPADDRVRAEVYNRIYTQPGLGIYNAGAGRLHGGFGRYMAGGITNDPPLGFHAIHIIVDSGHVTLYGVVNNSMDSTLANMAANQAGGVFSVDDDLIVQGAKGKE